MPSSRTMTGYVLRAVPNHLLFNISIISERARELTVMSTPLEMPDVVLRWLTGTALGQTSTTSAAAGEFHFSRALIEVANPTRYAIERSSTYISIYFWERGSSSVPNGVKYPGGTVDTSTWVIHPYRHLG